MLFKPELTRLIVAGKKTQTRRLVKPTVPALPDDATTDQRDRHAKQHCHYRTGRAYPLERLARRDEMSNIERARMDRPNRRLRGHPPKIAVGKINIASVRAERLGAITFTDARAEGFRTPADFKRAWLTIHDRAWPTVEEVPCPHCLGDVDRPDDELPPCEQCAGAAFVPLRPEPTDDEVAARFAARHADKLVWVIEFELSRDHEPRYLAERSELGYVPSEYNRHGRRVALIGEPEALTDDEHAKHVAPAAADRELDRKADAARQREVDRRALSLEERLVRARREAQMNHVNVSSETALLKRHRLDGDKAGELRALRAIERKAEPKRSAQPKAA